MNMNPVRIRLLEMQNQNPFTPAYSIAVSVLKTEVMENRLKAGERLKEVETAEMLGVSRSTIRRAFDMLVLDGIFLRRENKGVEVAPLISTNYREIIDVRIMLDSYAAKLASARRTAEDLRYMLTLVEATHEASPDEIAQLDLDFHKAIYAASHNSYINQIYEDIDIHFIRSRYLRADDALKEISDILNDHLLIYEAIKMQDSAKAEKLAEDHARKLLDPTLISQSWLIEKQ